MIPSCERAGKEAHDDCCALADPVDGRKSVSSPVLLPCPTTVSTLRTAGSPGEGVLESSHEVSCEV
mgnify:CR=1 FL=1